jgi:hypothetical protein
MEWELETGKIAISALLGFVFGRLQTSYTDRVSRTKDIQNELLKAIRGCASAAINYHSQALAKDAWPVNAFHLKHQLLRIRTDVYLVKDLCGRKDGVLQSDLLELLDAVTEFPFEANELPKDIDKNRLSRISLASEKLVQDLTTCRPKIF